MRKFTILILLSVLSIGVYAQKENKIGIKGGFNYEMGDISLNELPGASWEILSNPEVGNAWHLGLSYRAYMGDLFYLQPEVIYSSSTHSYSVKDPNGTIYDDNYKSDLVDMNIQLGVEFIKFVRAYGGIMGSINVNPSQNISGAESAFKTFRMGYQLGVGVNLSMFTVDLAYLSSFDSDNGHLNIGDVNIPLSQNRSQLQLSLGLQF